jgi:uncharacterized membrane protein YhaH (DUF805 family)
MNFWDAAKTCFRKYADFTGRAVRPEYWYFVLFVLIVQIILRFIYAPLSILFALAVLVPQIAVGARRLHDTGRSGWWLLLGLVPIVGAIVLIVWFCQKSEPIANRFGPPPLPHGALSAET